MVIDRKTLIWDVLRDVPGAAAVLENCGLECASCLGEACGSIEVVALAHDLNPDMLVAEFNRLARRQENSRKS